MKKLVLSAVLLTGYARHGLNAREASNGVRDDRGQYSIQVLQEDPPLALLVETHPKAQVDLQKRRIEILPFFGNPGSTITCESFKLAKWMHGIAQSTCLQIEGRDKFEWQVSTTYLSGRPFVSGHLACCSEDTYEFGWGWPTKPSALLPPKSDLAPIVALSSYNVLGGSGYTNGHIFFKSGKSRKEVVAAFKKNLASQGIATSDTPIGARADDVKRGLSISLDWVQSDSGNEYALELLNVGHFVPVRVR
jgi:hypothetical protein